MRGLPCKEGLELGTIELQRLVEAHRTKRGVRMKPGGAHVG